MGPFRSSILLLALMFLGFGALAFYSASNRIDRASDINMLTGAFLFSLALVLLYFRFRRE
jgi:formate/nitrite transporter FocA (FNT family)